MVARGWEEGGSGELLYNGNRVSVWRDETSSGDGGGAGSSAL